METRFDDKQLKQALFKDKRIITSFSEIAYNILRGNVDLKPSERSKLKRQKRFLIDLAQKGKYELKYHMLIGILGKRFLASVIPIILPAIKHVKTNRK